MPIIQPGARDKREDKLIELNVNMLELVGRNMAIDVMDEVIDKKEKRKISDDAGVLRSGDGLPSHLLPVAHVAELRRANEIFRRPCLILSAAHTAGRSRTFTPHARPA